MMDKIKKFIYRVSHCMEIAVSIVIVAVICVMLLRMIQDLITNPGSVQIDHFHEFLAGALSLVVGIEFVNLLCKHTAETLIEVLMFATARQMIVEHLDTVQTLIGIAALALLFAIRKYLILGSGPKDDKL